MDVWDEVMIQCCERIGNQRARKLYEYMMPSGARLSTNVDSFTLERSIRAKYEQRQYYNPNFREIFEQLLQQAPAAPSESNGPLGKPVPSSTTAPKTASNDHSGWTEFKSSSIVTPSASIAPPARQVAGPPPSAPTIEDMWVGPAASTTPQNPSAMGASSGPSTGKMDIHELFSSPQSASTYSYTGAPMPAFPASVAYGHMTAPHTFTAHSGPANPASGCPPTTSTMMSPSPAGGEFSAYYSSSSTRDDAKSDILSAFAHQQHLQQQQQRVYSAWQPHEPGTSM